MVATEQVHDPQVEDHEGAEVPDPPGLLPQSDDEDVIDDITEPRLLVKQLRLEMKTNKEKEDKHERESTKDLNMNNTNVNMSNTYDDSGIQQSLRNFDAKSVCKPVPWNGEDEAEFKMWKERLATYMSSGADKAWRSIFKFINDMDESEDLDDATKVNTMLIELKISMDFRLSLIHI